MDAELTFRLLGGLCARRATERGEVELDLGGPQPRRLLAALLLSLDQPLPPDRLIELVWGDAAPASARGSLQAYISNLRRVLAPSRGAGRTGAAGRVIVLRPGGYQLQVARSQLDIGTFEADAAHGAAELDASRPEAAVKYLSEALDRWAPLLPEMTDVPFVRAEAVRLEARRAAAFERLQTARVALGDHHGAIAELSRAVSLDPRAERLWALLAMARYRSGHPADAIATVHAARAALSETGHSLGPELRRLETDLYAQVVTLDPVGELGARRADPPPASLTVTTTGPAATSPRTRRCRRNPSIRAAAGPHQHPR